MKPKLLVICFDGLDSNLCKEWDLSFVERGELGMMVSQYGKTVPSWTSIYTGLTLEQHQIGVGKESGWRGWVFNQVAVTQKSDAPGEQPARYKYDYRTFPFVWDDLNEKGLTVGLFGIPLTYPAFHINDWCVSGFPSETVTNRHFWPTEIGLHLKNFCPDIFTYLDPHYITKMVYRSEDHTNAYYASGGLKMVAKFAQKRIENLARVWTKNPVDVVFAGFNYLDMVGHIAISTYDHLKALYAIVDQTINVVMDFFDAEKTLIVSDHGGSLLSPELLARLVERANVKREIPPEGNLFQHSQSGTYFIAGDHLQSVKGLKEGHRMEYQIKSEVLRLASTSY